MESNRSSHRISIGPIYYEFSTAQQELQTLDTLVKKIPSQQALTKHSYVHDYDPMQIINSSSTHSFHLEVIGIFDSTTSSRLVSGTIALHAQHYTSTEIYQSLIELFHKIFSLADEIIDNQIRRYKARDTHLIKAAHTRLLSSFIASYNTLIPYLLGQYCHWHTTNSTFRAIDTMCTYFTSETLAHILKNKFGYEILNAVPDVIIIKYQNELINAFLTADMLSTTKHALIKRLSLLHYKNNPYLPSLSTKYLSHHSKNTNLDPENRLLILEHSTDQWLIKHYSQARKVLESIRKTIGAAEHKLQTRLHSLAVRLENALQL
jgi:hypothetical protein